MPNPKVRTLTIGGVTYDLQDNISGYITGITSSDVTTALGFTPYNATNPNGYTSNTGTITSVKTTAGAHTTINVSSGAANFNVPTKTSHLTNDSGFLTSYTETDPTVPSWAKASSKPSYNFSEIGNTPTTLSGYGITNAYTKTEVDGLVSGVLHYKGTKANYAALPSSENTTGDVWHLTDTGAEWAWDGSTWQELGTAIDLSNYLTTSDIAAWAKQSTKPTYTAAEVGALPDSTVIPSKVSDLTNDSGFITSYTDEKVKTTLLNSGSSAMYLIGGADSAITETKQVSSSLYYTLASTYGILTIGDSSNGIKGILRLLGTTNNTRIHLSHEATANRSISFPDASGTLALTSDIPTVPTKVSDLTNDSGFISSYTETDPVFSASAAAGITSTDISNWNAKVSDDKTWGGVSITSVIRNTDDLYYVPAKNSALLTGTAEWMKATSTPTAQSIAKWDNNAYLYSTTPSANDNSTKVATTAYVDAAIPDTSGFVSKSGDTMSGRLTLAYSTSSNNGHSSGDLEFTGRDNTFTSFYVSGYNGSTSSYITKLKFRSGGTNSPNGVILDGIETPSDADSNYDKYAANKKYVDDSIGAISIPTKTSDLTNDSNFVAKSTTTVTLTTTWSSKTQTISVTGVTASNTVIITPTPASYNAYCEYGVYCSAQSSSTLTFTCDEVPTSSLTVNVLILN